MWEGGCGLMMTAITQATAAHLPAQITFHWYLGTGNKRPLVQVLR
jgi:hypothetical protein